MPKVLSQSAKDKILLFDKNSWHPDTIADKMGVSKSTVYRVLKAARDIPQEAAIDCHPIQSVSYRLPEGSSVEVKISGGNGVVATLVIDAIGLVFKRPKQKIASQHLSWELLDRLSMLGLTTR